MGSCAFFIFGLFYFKFIVLVWVDFFQRRIVWGTWADLRQVRPGALHAARPVARRHRRRAREAAGPRPAVSRAGEARDVERAYGGPVAEVFESFDETPVASASIAQVHFAELPAARGGRQGAAAGHARRHRNDLELMHVLARGLVYAVGDGKRLRPREVVAEFEKTPRRARPHAGSSERSQLRRNFQGSPLLLRARGALGLLHAK